ncbi:MAG: hypothetical protein FWB74_03885 [Defluviitaleaceae bacterium]|nr:hypothetical protein [Defluviitaleaceae bacterium]
MKKRIFAICLMAVMLISFSACDSGGNEPDIVLLWFTTLGFEVELPIFWHGRHSAVVIDNFEPEMQMVAVYHPRSAEFGGVLFRAGRALGEHFTYDDPPFPAGGIMILAQTGGYTYFINFPSDVQHSPGTASGAEFLEMIGYNEPGHWDFLRDSFRFLN